MRLGANDDRYLEGVLAVLHSPRLDIEVDVHLRLGTQLSINLRRAGHLERQILHILNIDDQRLCLWRARRLRGSCRFGHPISVVTIAPETAPCRCSAR